MECVFPTRGAIEQILFFLSKIHRKKSVIFLTCVQKLLCLQQVFVSGHTLVLSVFNDTSGTISTIILLLYTQQGWRCTLDGLESFASPGRV